MNSSTDKHVKNNTFCNEFETEIIDVIHRHKMKQKEIIVKIIIN